MSTELTTTHRAAAARWTARVALAFSAVVLVLMLINAVAARSAYPVNVARLEALQHDLRIRPDDEALRKRVRDEDRRIRTAYFRHRDFALRGAWLLLGGIVVFLIAAEVARRAHAESPTPRPDAAARARAAAEATYRALVGVGGILAGALLTLTVLSRHDTAAEYVRAASRGVAGGSQRPTAAPTSPAGGPVSSLPVPTQAGTDGGVSIPKPQGGTLASPGTTMVPVGTANPVGGGAPVPSELLKRPLPAVESFVPPNWHAQWPRFRGPTGMGIATGARPPLRWNGQTGQGILWKTPIPLPGPNSPIVWQDRVFVTGADEQRREIYALDANSGRLVWRAAIPWPAGAPLPKVQQDTGYAPATLATDGARIVAVYANGDVACVDLSGKLLWMRSFGPLENPYGHASSPVIFGSGVILQLDQGHGDDDKSKLMALDLTSGKTVWQIQRPVAASWSTPILVLVNGKEQLITTASPWVIAYDPHDGRELWRADCLGGEVAVSPAAARGYVLVANQGSNAAAIRPDGTGDVTKTAVAWTAGDGLPDIVSPLIFDDLMLLITTDGFLTCVEVATGKMVWQADLGATVRASPVLADGKIYILDASGTMHILKPGRSHAVLGTSPIGESTNATPAFVGSRIYIRGKQHLYCVGTP